MNSSSYNFDSGAILDEYSILDTPPEAIFDDLTSMAATLCEAPIALLSLLDQDRAWFKSRVGVGLDQVPIGLSFCMYAVREPGVFIVPDATSDSRFSQNPFVTGPPEIRFYAAAPVMTSDGITIGTLCVLDRVPRALRSDQIQGLTLLAKHASHLLELRKSTFEASSNDQSLSTLAGYSILFHFAPVPLIVCDVRDLRIIEANLAAANLYGFTQQEMMEMPLRNLFLSERECSFSKDGSSSLAYHQRKNGETLRLQLKASAILHRGEQSYLLSIEPDDSGARLPQAERIELPMVCHELRQPLTAIHSSLGYLIGIASQDLPIELRKILDIGYRNTLRMLRLVSDLQETSALTLGITRVVFSELNLNDVIAEAIELNEPAALQAESKILFSGPLSGAFVRSDHDRLIQVFSNLFSNALRFSPAGKPVSVSILRNNGNYEVRIKDYGPGIPSEVCKQIFEGMVSGERRKAKQGSGLGLYICKLILDALGGTIRFETHENAGTTFYVTLSACR